MDLCRDSMDKAIDFYGQEVPVPESCPTALESTLSYTTSWHDDPKRRQSPKGETVSPVNVDERASLHYLRYNLQPAKLAVY